MTKAEHRKEWEARVQEVALETLFRNKSSLTLDHDIFFRNSEPKEINYSLI